MKFGKSIYLIQLREEDQEGEAINIDTYENPDEALRAWDQDKDLNAVQVREDNLKSFDVEFYAEDEFDMLPKKLQKILKKFKR